MSRSTFSTPSLVSESLSRVCDAASTYKLSSRLSLISACLIEASPCTTLTKSYTTRRSQPMIRSRLRRPTSKSITATFLPRRARPQARLALVVVLPTPPLPDVTTMISVNVVLRGAPVACDGAGFLFIRRLERLFLSPRLSALFQRRNLQLFVLQPHLHRLAAQFLRNIFQHFVMAGHGDQFGMELAAENARFLVALRARERAAAQCAVDVDRAVGDDLGAGSDSGQHG